MDHQLWISPSKFLSEVGISRSTLYRLVKREGVRGVMRIPGRSKKAWKVLINKELFLKWLNNQSKEVLQ